jgi:threonine dehydrogenase-like Zn-dependent dehydrogenase
MRAIRFDGERVVLDEVAVPARPGEALVRVLKAGVCNTDLEIVRGYAGFRGTLGHEFVGIVERAASTELVGARVVGEINCGCGACRLCAAGDPRHCAGRTVLGIVDRDGTFAEYLSLPEANLRRVPDSISTEDAVFVEPLAAACEVLEQVCVGRDDRVAVVGDGKLAQLVARVLATTGARVTVFGRHVSKLALLEPFGVETALSSEACVVDTARTAFDVVVEASGSRSGITLAQRLVRPRGTIVLKSTIQDDVTIDTRSLIVDEVTLVGSRCGRFEDALELLASGRVSVASLVSRRMPLESGAEVIDAAAAPGVLKVIVEVSEG